MDVEALQNDCRCKCNACMPQSPQPLPALWPRLEEPLTKMSGDEGDTR